MPKTGMPNQGTALVDDRLKISTSWFQFLFYLFNLTGAGKEHIPVPVGSAKATLDFPNTLAGTSSDLTITVPGALDGDLVTIGVPNACVLADCCYTGWVSAANTVTVRLNNYSGLAKNPPSGVFQAGVARYQ